MKQEMDGKLQWFNETEDLDYIAAK